MSCVTVAYENGRKIYLCGNQRLNRGQVIEIEFNSRHADINRRQLGGELTGMAAQQEHAKLEHAERVARGRLGAGAARQFHLNFTFQFTTGGKL